MYNVFCVYDRFIRPVAKKVKNVNVHLDISCFLPFENYT